MKILKYIPLLLIALACKEEYPISNIPEIDLVSTTPLEVIEFQSPITFTIDYTDGDGDLGENDADAKNLIITDPRIDVHYEYRIKELVPGNAEVPIKGRLILNMPNAFITDGSNEQTVNFQVYVVDRAGNKSNVETSSTITIRR